jgi:hypothetical protein
MLALLLLFCSFNTSYDSIPLWNALKPSSDARKGKLLMAKTWQNDQQYIYVRVDVHRSICQRSISSLIVKVTAVLPADTCMQL